MPTRTDLNSVFAALEREADGYHLNLDLADIARTTPARRNRGRLPAMLGAAAIVAALAVGGAVWSTQTTDHPAAGGFGVATSWLAARSLPVAVEPGSGWTLTSPTLSDDVAAATLSGPTGTASLTVAPTGTGELARQPQQGVEHVTINGHHGWYASPGGTGIAHANKQDRDQQLLWRYAPGSWARLVPGTHQTLSRADLLAAARSLDFADSTPLYVPFRLSHGPGGALDVVVTSVSGDEPATPHGGLSAKAIWHSDGDAPDMVWVFTSHKSLSAYGRQSLNVDGYPAVWWDGGGDTLTVDLGAGLLLQIAHGNDEDQPSAMSLDQATTFFKTITLASKPDDPSTWFPAATALP